MSLQTIVPQPAHASSCDLHCSYLYCDFGAACSLATSCLRPNFSYQCIASVLSSECRGHFRTSKRAALRNGSYLLATLPLFCTSGLLQHNPWEVQSRPLHKVGRARL